MLKRNELASLAKEVIEISKKGQYKYNGKLIKFNTENNTELYKESSIEKIKSIVLKHPHYENTTYEVINQSTIDAVFELSKNKNKNMNLGILNFASAYHAGGGFINGAMAQEEALAQCSDLFVKQINGPGKEYYEINKNANNLFYTDTMFMSNVTFFKNSNFEFIENPVMCNVLTSPAVNMSKIKDYTLIPEAKKAMKNRMRNILYLFALYNCEDIVLGAFGCGVFGNNPEDVSNMWYKLLEEEKLCNYFKRVRFSILDRPGRDNNFKIFENKFKK